MKNAMVSILTMTLLGALGGCAMEDPAHPDEAADTSELAIRPRAIIGINFARACAPGLAVRSCDDPGMCDTGARLTDDTRVNVDSLDGAKHMAHIQGTPNWVATLSPSGAVILSSESGPCNNP
jgi:hypothetical protein